MSASLKFPDIPQPVPWIAFKNTKKLELHWVFYNFTNWKIRFLSHMALETLPRIRCTGIETGLWIFLVWVQRRLQYTVTSLNLWPGTAAQLWDLPKVLIAHWNMEELKILWTLFSLCLCLSLLTHRTPLAAKTGMDTHPRGISTPCQHSGIWTRGLLYLFTSRDSDSGRLWHQKLQEKKERTFR